MTSLRNIAVACLPTLAIACYCAVTYAAEAEPPINFNRDVRPILAKNCFSCHGTDPAERKADLRLDLRKGDEKIHGAESVIDAANPAESDLTKRITSDDPDEHMPPPDSGKTLTAEQIKTLRKWVDEGAKYQVHWAFVSPERPEVPTVKNQA